MALNNVPKISMCKFIHLVNIQNVKHKIEYQYTMLKAVGRMVNLFFEVKPKNPNLTDA